MQILLFVIETTRVEGRKLEGASDPVYGNVPAGLVGATLLVDSHIIFYLIILVDYFDYVIICA